MTSATQAASRALIELLDGNIAGVAIFADVPEDHAPPVGIIGDLDSEKIGNDGDPDRRITTTLTFVFSGESRAPVQVAQEQARALLDGADVRQDGFRICIEVNSSTILTPETGEGQVGVSTLTIFALAG